MPHFIQEAEDIHLLYFEKTKGKTNIGLLCSTQLLEMIGK